MKKSSAIRAELAELQAEVQAIVDIATEENREVTDAEKVIIDDIQGIGDKPGKIDTLSKDLERAIRTEARMQERAAEFGRQFGGSTGASGQVMRNGQGQRVVALSRGDSYSTMCRTEVAQVPNSLGEFIVAAVRGPSRHTPDPIRAAMSEGNDSRGGFMVPFESMPGLIDLVRAKSVIANAGATTILMNGPQLLVPTVETDPSFDVVPELGTIPLTDVVIGARNLTAVKGGARFKLSRELVEDGTNVPQTLEGLISASAAAQQDYYAINGHANMHPMGLLQNTDINSTGSVGAIDWTDLATATTTARTANHEPNSFIMAPSVHDSLFNTETGDGSTAARGWLDAPPSIRDKQFLHSTNCPVGNVICGDFSYFVIGMRQGALIEVSAEADDAFSTHSVYVKITWRSDYIVTRPAAFEILADVTAS